MKWLVGGAVLLALVIAAGAFAWLNGGTAGAAAGPPTLITEIARAFPDAIFYKQTDEKIIALTIDDVPGPNDDGDEATRLILDTIAEYNAGIADPDEKVRATFFVISGNLSDGSTILERIRADGHEIGNHGDVDGTAAALRPEAFEDELRRAHDRLTMFTDQPIRWFRPGRGLFNRAMVEALGRMEGYEPRFALASMLPVDTFRPADDARFTAWYVRQHIFPGSILLVHGGSPEQSRQTADALRLILPELQRQGYRVSTFSELWDSE